MPAAVSEEAGRGEGGKCRPSPAQLAGPAARTHSRPPAAYLVDSLQSHRGRRVAAAPGAGTGTGEGWGRDQGREAASVISGRPEKMESSEARVRWDQRRAEAHSAPEPAAAVTASPGGSLFMRCRPSSRRRHRRGRGLFLLSSAPPPQQSRIPPPGSKSPGLGLGRCLSVRQPEGLTACCRWTEGRAGGRAGGAAGVGPPERGVGPGRGAGREARGLAGQGKEGRAAPAAEGYGPPL